MPVVPREEMSFALLVEQYFLAQKGRGLLVSATDRALIETWEASGAPVWVICEGIQAAFESHRRKRGPEARPPASLRYCRKAVEKALDVWREGRVGGRETET